MQLTPTRDSQEQLNQAWRSIAKPVYVGETKSGEPAQKSSASIFAVRREAAVIALLVGTGGLSTAAYISERNQRGYRFTDIGQSTEQPRKRKTDMDIPNATGNLSRVKAVFAPSVTELASLFTVSRQTIYNWQSGEPIAAENQRRLERLAAAADLFDAHDLSQKISAFRRPISAGKNFFELVKAGSDPVAIARELIGIIQDELRQRQRLQERLADRKRKPFDRDELGSPHLDESA